MTNTEVDSASVMTASGPITVALRTPLAGSPELGWIVHTPDWRGQGTRLVGNAVAVSASLEVLRAIARNADTQVLRTEDLSPFLRRPGNRDCLRVLHKLRSWFLRQYDIRHAAAVLHHHDNLAAGRDDAEKVLSLHTTRTYAVALLLLAAPFLGAVFAYDRAPIFFDALATGEVIVVDGGERFGPA